MNLARWLPRAAALFGDRPAVAHGTAVVWSHAGFAQVAAAAARGLAARGVGSGDRVGLFMTNSPAYLAALWGIWWAGAVAVPINARLHGAEVGWILQHSGARLCVADAAHAQVLTGHVPTGCTLLAEPAGLWHDDADRAAGEPVPRSEDDAMWLFYTSGTTGRPKGVTLTARNLRWATAGYQAMVQPVAPGDAFLHPAPLSHGSGMYHLPYVMQGGVNVIPASGGLDEAEFFALAAHWGRASTFAAPTIVKRLADFARARSIQPEGLATIVYGGAPMYLADLIAAREVLGPHLAQIYGQGESPMTITALPTSVIEDRAHPRWAERCASVGVAQPMVEVSVRERESGRSLPTGEIGEVCVRGDVVMAGYWHNPEATAEAIRDGWLCTGDVGRLDADGFLTLLDRSKDLVISGGNNIYPREIEEVLLTHPAVQEVSVIGRPDAQWGEALVAYVVARDGAATARDERGLAAALEDLCLQHIARYKRPKVWRFVAALPKNNYGKVLKTELRAEEARRTAAENAA